MFIRITVVYLYSDNNLKIEIMKIECDFKIKDNVFFIKQNKIQNGDIHGINITVIETGEVTIKYKVTNSFPTLRAEDIFLSKSELLKTL